MLENLGQVKRNGVYFKNCFTFLLQDLQVDKSFFNGMYVRGKVLIHIGCTTIFIKNHLQPIDVGMRWQKKRNRHPIGEPLILDFHVEDVFPS